MSTWVALSFGVTLGLVVGLRLTMAGLLFVGAVLIAVLLLCPLFAARYLTSFENHAPTSIRVERVPAVERGKQAVATPALAAPAFKDGRRGGWHHLEEMRSQHG
jgi:type IV secretory pathway VirB3-like protein